MNSFYIIIISNYIFNLFLLKQLEDVLQVTNNITKSRSPALENPFKAFSFTFSVSIKYIFLTISPPHNYFIFRESPENL